MEFRHSEEWTLQRCTRVSILVFLDMEFRPKHQNLKLPSKPVSILVFLDMEFRPRNGWQSKTGLFNVSILVFLDMEFRPGSGAIEKSIKTSFNPCFSGYGIQTFTGQIPGPLSKVSILVFLDMEFRLVRANSKSLSIQVSILVFLDMEFRQKIQPSKLNPQEFQSLFFWIWNSDLYS